MNTEMSISEDSRSYTKTFGCIDQRFRHRSYKYNTTSFIVFMFLCVSWRSLLVAHCIGAIVSNLIGSLSPTMYFYASESCYF